jgi:heme-degrading monooxygenase HmoA
VSQS